MSRHDDTELDWHVPPRGTGEPLVCLHGITDSPRAWDAVTPALAVHHEVRAMALAGHAGGPVLPPGVYPSVPALVDDLERRMDRDGITRAHLVGNSLGGLLALHLACRGRAVSVVAFSPGGGWKPGSAYARALVAVLGTAGGLLRYGNRPARKLADSATGRKVMLGLMLARPGELTAETAATYIHGVAGCSILRPLLRSIDAAGTPPGTVPTEVPVRIVWGDRDRLLPRALNAPTLLNWVPHAEAVTLPDAGHVPMHDVPAAVAATILDVTLPGTAHPSTSGRIDDPAASHHKDVSR